jgi:hypothetical protein
VGWNIVLVIIIMNVNNISFIYRVDIAIGIVVGGIGLYP